VRHPALWLALLGWPLLAWLIVGQVMQMGLQEDERAEMVLLERQVGKLSDGLGNEQVRLRGIPELVAGSPEVVGVLTAWHDAGRADGTVESRRAAWSRDAALAALDRRLSGIDRALGVEAVYVITPAGDCIAASNADTKSSFVGSNFSDRQYVREAVAGQPGFQFAVGRVSRLPGLYFSAPVTQNGRLLGVAVAKVNLDGLRHWVAQSGAFVVDEYGVIILAGDRSLEMHALPGSRLARLPQEELLARYNRTRFEAALVRPWESARSAGAKYFGGSQVPLLMTSRPLGQSGFQVWLTQPFVAAANFDSERRNAFLWLGLIGELVIVSVVFGFSSLRERARVVDSIRESEQRLRELVESAPFGAHLYQLEEDERLVFVGANQTADRILGLDHRALVGKTILEAFPALAGSEVPAAYVRVARFGGRFELKEISYPLAIGMRQFEVHALRTGHQRMAAFFTDISERKLAEQQLIREKQKFELLMQTSGDGIYLLDAQGKLIEVNDKFCEMLGYPREELVGMQVSQWNAGMSDEEIRTKLDENLTRESVFETRHRRKDGTIREIEVSAKPIRFGEQWVIWNSARDITERKWAAVELMRSEAEYRHLIDMLPYGVVIHRKGVVLVANQAAAHQLSADQEALPGTQIMERVHPDCRAVVRERIQRAVEQGKDSGLIEERLIRMDGSVFDAEVVALSIPYEGAPASLVIFNDITRRKEVEADLKLAATVFRSSSEAIMVTDVDDRIITVNPAFTVLTGYSVDEVVGATPPLLHNRRQNRRFYREMRRELARTGSWQGEIWNRRKDGELFAEYLSINTVYGGNGEVELRVSIFSDITEKKRKDELIWTQANFDPLTKLANRRLFRDRLDQEMKKIQRENGSLALLFIDLDHFKEVNDTLGHDIGDLLLVEATARLRQCVRESDSIARLGGDEFTVILPNYGSRANIERIARHIISVLSQPFSLGGHDNIYISASIGITLFPEDATDLETLLKQADQAMYVAKEEGRNQYAYFTQTMQREVLDKLSMIGDLRLAIQQGQMELYYQPIVDMNTGQILKAEALLRWMHPLRGSVSPADFIPLAEESGLIVDIGGWVFEQAIATMKRWQGDLGMRVQVSVNKSPAQFKSDAGEHWLGRLSESGLTGNSLTVEITEGILLKDSYRVKDQLLEFRNNGIEVSIDDFGTGFSSLSYLKKFDIDYLKIDISFVRSITENEADRVLTEAIIVMAHKLGIKAIAEGIETREQYELLKDLGCDYGQGYYISRPLPEREFERMLREQGVCEV
jgi:diguanylate cyclase (GGDEF)-like protein/PAS domain S-box-containing protein